MFSAGSSVVEWLKAGKIARLVTGKAERIELSTRRVTISDADGLISSEAFDAIFVCAGTLGSGELALRSLPALREIRIVDNATCTFPILYTKHSADDLHLALTSALLTVKPQDRSAGLPTASIQLYSAFDHMWRYYAPRWAWSALRPFGRLLRRRLIIGRAFLDGAFSQSYSLRLGTDGKRMLSLHDAPDVMAHCRRVVRRAGRSLARAGAFVSTRLITRQRTSSHYLGGLPIGGGIVSTGGLVAPGVYFADGITFPSAPATSPTFTIMANGHRVATGWLESLASR
jgi:hypothetical protein